MKLTLKKSSSSDRMNLFLEEIKKEPTTARKLAKLFGIDPVHAMRTLKKLRARYSEKLDTSYRQIGDGKGTISQEVVYAWKGKKDEHLRTGRRPRQERKLTLRRPSR